MITYCTNIHPGESWEETFAALREHIPPVKASVSPDAPFPIGLRLSFRAAEEFAADGPEQFQGWLRDHDCFVPTLNGFPFGDFHGAPIKGKVYLPDWRSAERVDYAIRLADILSALLPDGTTGSVSTVPVGLKGVVTNDHLPLVSRNLSSVLRHLHGIHRNHGRKIMLALEPEPGCLLETTAEVRDFFGRMEVGSELREYLGICLDCCHQAVEFEEPGECLAMLSEAGIALAKVQISSALRMVDPDYAILRQFVEDSYLHQVVIRRRNGTLERYIDLPNALDGHRREPGDEWRCHFHLPLSYAGSREIGTTRPFPEKLIPLLPAGTLLEAETYTWGVLPPHLRRGTLIESIISELNWLKEQRNAPHRRP